MVKDIWYWSTYLIICGYIPLGVYTFYLLLVPIYIALPIMIIGFITSIMIFQELISLRESYSNLLIHTENKTPSLRTIKRRI